MNIEEIVEQLEFNDGSFPRDAVKAAISNREEITPHLLKILEQAKDNPEEIVAEESYMAHIYAMFLLAQFREKRAYPLIVDFFSLPDDIPYETTGDVVTGHLPKILASVSCGDTSLITALVENENAEEFVRGATLESLLALVACGEKSREEVMAYYQSLFHGRLEREYSQAWNALISCCDSLYPEEVHEEIKQAFQDELIDELFINMEDVNRSLVYGKQNTLDKLRSGRLTLITDTVNEMESWACFQTPESHNEPWISDLQAPIAQQFTQARLPQHQQSIPPKKQKKIGRNEPCPCGSGKKYKKCCGA